MGAILTGSLVGGFDTNAVDGGAYSISKAADNADQNALNRAVPGFSTFHLQAFTDSAETVNVLDLTAAGMNMPVNSLRNIRTRAWGRNKAGTKVAYSESVVPVIGNGATAPALCATTLATSTDKFLDTRYTVRQALVGSGVTVVDGASAAMKFLKAEPIITGSHVWVQIGGGLSGVDLQWYVEVEVGALKILKTPIATAGS